MRLSPPMRLRVSRSSTHPCGQDGQPLTHAARAKLVTNAAKKGGHVVRLMDGDPILFHGFAEEAAACEKNGIPFEVVPGASSVTAVPAYAGIPLTTSKSRAVHVVTHAGDQAGLGHPRRRAGHGGHPRRRRPGRRGS